MTKPTLRAHDLYMNRTLRPDEKPEDGFHPEPPPRPMLKNPHIESDAYRDGLLENEGDVSVIVEAGDELGQIRIGVQYEGAHGMYDTCLREQGALVSDALKWIDEIYEPLKGHFVVDVVSNPCPKGDSSLLQVVEPSVNREHSREEINQTSNTVDRNVTR